MSKSLLRLSQLVTSFGPGAMLDLPEWSVMVAGLDRWDDAARRKIVEPRLLRRLPDGLQRGLATPPVHDESPYRKDTPRLQVIVFPQWFVATRGQELSGRVRRRLVRFRELDPRSRTLVEGSGRDKRQTRVVPVRFVAACEHGHVQDFEWRSFVRCGSSGCRAPLWLEEAGATGDAAEISVACECGARRALYEALGPDNKVLGPCRGRRPWLDPDAGEPCDRHLRLLVRTASNAYFPVTVTGLCLPVESEQAALDRLVSEHARDLADVHSAADLQTAFRFNEKLRKALESWPPEAVLAALERLRGAGGGAGQRPRLKPEELEVLAGSALGSRSDRAAVLVTEPCDRMEWDPRGSFPVIERLVLVHRLKVVTALRGFTRFDFTTPDTDGELDPEIRIQELSLDPKPYPAIEQRGEGLFLLFDRDAVGRWSERPEVMERAGRLESGFKRWAAEHGRRRAKFPGPVWIALHTISHLLLAEIALEAGYPLASLKERVYAVDGGGFGILLYAASTDVGGTLGGLTALGPRLAELLHRALERALICANDPVCAEHDPARNRSGHPLAGAACLGCVLLPEPCCEMRNDFLDRALAVGTLAQPGLGLLEPANG